MNLPFIGSVHVHLYHLLAGFLSGGGIGGTVWHNRAAILGFVKKLFSSKVPRKEKLLMIVMDVARLVRNLSPEDKAFVKTGAEFLLNELTAKPAPEQKAAP